MLAEAGLAELMESATFGRDRRSASSVRIQGVRAGSSDATRVYDLTLADVT